VTAVVVALAMLADRDLTAAQVADLAYRIEREDLGISGGWQDQYAAAFGGFNLLEFSRSGVRVRPIRVGADAIAELNRNLLLCYTGAVRRNVGLIERQIEMHREGREDTILGMKRLQEMAFAMRHAIEAGDVATIGPLLTDAFQAKKQMNPFITDDTPIDRMLRGAAEAGATGGKICGAGGGGYLLIAAAPATHANVRRALTALGGQLAPFAFSQTGVRATRSDTVWSPRA
jgi:D-glycero-alpha-D-manno-heptose-7-phosphate kinase